MDRKRKTKQLLQLLEEQCRHIGIFTSITPLAYGVENCVFKATEKGMGDVAIRVPWNRFSGNPTDSTGYDSRKGLEKEAKLTEHCFKHGLPVPKIYKLHYSDQIDFIIQEFIAGDKEPGPLDEIGRLAYALHQIETLPEFDGMSHQTDSYFAERIVRRLSAVSDVLGEVLPFPDAKEIETVLNSYRSKKRLLHMDLRPENLIFRQSRVKAIFDWTNALIGDPVLELMRVKDYGFLNEDFINGYTGFDEELARVPEVVQWLYQFDTSVMLTLLFYAELKDVVQGKQAKNRLMNLYLKIKSEM